MSHIATVSIPAAPAPFGWTASDRDPARDVSAVRLAPWQVNRVTRFVAANLEQRIGVKDLAQLARLSVSHFARAFRCSMGLAPHAYLLRCRIERAQDLILGSDETLAGVALRSGFADQPHLTKVFSRIVGQSPGMWRRRYRATFA